MSPTASDSPVSEANATTASPVDDLRVVPSLEELVEELRSEFGERFVHLERMAARQPKFGTLDTPLNGEVVDALGSIDLDRLWSHQGEAINRIRQGESTVVATGTASGKSLCYLLPVAEAISTPMKRSTALGIFPTKALAQDQLRALTKFDFPGVTAATYDGDSSPEERTWVRNNANVVLTNPEMLHGGILPTHRRWSDFLASLDYVVVDELHVFRGIFGLSLIHI